MQYSNPMLVVSISIETTVWFSSLMLLFDLIEAEHNTMRVEIVH